MKTTVDMNKESSIMGKLGLVFVGGVIGAVFGPKAMPKIRSALVDAATVGVKAYDAVAAAVAEKTKDKDSILGQARDRARKSA